MGSRRLWLFPVLQILVSSAQLCEIPPGNGHRVASLSAELLSLAHDATRAPDPSLYLGLRLSERHSLEKERLYLERLQGVYQPNDSNDQVAPRYQEQPGTGRLALYLLALRGACHDMDTPEAHRLVTQLKLHLHKEKAEIGPESLGRPLSNYYQYGLGLLALCVHGKMVDGHVIHKLLHAEEHGRLGIHGKLSVDTEAMAGLAFACLQRAAFYPPELRAKLRQSVERVKGKILEGQTPAGAFGNIYSSPLAAQFLLAVGQSQKEPECPKGMAFLLRHLEQGDSPDVLFKSQLLPVLNGKSYLDIASVECHAETDGLALGTPSPTLPQPTRQSKRIAVQLIVKRPPRRLPLYRRVLTVAPGSSLLDVLKVASRQERVPLTFETQETFSGPFLMALMGVKAQEGEHKYWKILRAPNSLLEQGLADYLPQDKETIILRFSPW
ncbi:transcobalamin-2 [Anolis carolinensis]|uniref:transcobalamin-2 n=1 Tax=Anolis carolinensis TaxID=28377 RepID=UPI002F2B6C93